MADTLTKEQRSQRMALIQGKNSGPEMIVRRLIHGMGFRYRLHVTSLPGKPDLVFPRGRKIILVHGCFWHRHDDPTCKLARMPKSRLSFWRPKLERNKARDERVERELTELGWEVLKIWECQIVNKSSLAEEIRSFLKL